MLIKCKFCGREVNSDELKKALRVQCDTRSCKIEHANERKLIPNGYCKVFRNGWEFVEPMSAEVLCSVFYAKQLLNIGLQQLPQREKTENSVKTCGSTEVIPLF